MFRQQQDHPITKMTINRDERSFPLNSPLQNRCIISPCPASFLRADNIMPCVSQKRSQFDSKPLVRDERLTHVIHLRIAGNLPT
jgi:hypothetical protein